MSYAKGINPEMIRWCRERVGYQVNAAAKKIGISDHELLNWESGQSLPTIHQAIQMGQVYKKPWAVFFLTEKPKFSILNDFRSIPSIQEGKYSPALSFLIDELLDQQRWASEYILNSSNKKNRFFGTWKTLENHKTLAAEIRKALDIDFSVVFKLNGRREVLKYLISLVENLEIFVLRTTGTKVSLQDMRGMFLGDKFAPFIILNSKDALSAQIFTLMHETAHLWIGAEGVSNNDWRNAFVKDNINNIELFCNKVASEIVLPEEVISKLFSESKSIKELSSLFKISEEAIALKLFTLRLINENELQKIQKQTKESLEILRKKGGGDYHINRFNRNGKLFTQVVLSAYQTGRILTLHAANLLGIRVNHLKKQKDYANII